MLKVAVCIVSEIAEKDAVIVKRAKLACIVLRCVVGCKIDDDLNSVLVGGSDEVVKLGPCIVCVTEMFFNAFEIASLVTVIRSGRIATTVGYVGV